MAVSSDSSQPALDAPSSVVRVQIGQEGLFKEVPKIPKKTQSLDISIKMGNGSMSHCC